MSTQGFLVMSFDFVSACIHDNRFELEDEARDNAEEEREPADNFSDNNDDEEEEKDDDEEVAAAPLKSKPTMSTRTFMGTKTSNKVMTPEDEAKKLGENLKRSLFKMIDPESNDFKKRHYYLFYRLANC